MQAKAKSGDQIYHDRDYYGNMLECGCNYHAVSTSDFMIYSDLVNSWFPPAFFENYVFFKYKEDAEEYKANKGEPVIEF